MASWHVRKAGGEWIQTYPPGHNAGVIRNYLRPHDGAIRNMTSGLNGDAPPAGAQGRKVKRQWLRNYFQLVGIARSAVNGRGSCCSVSEVGLT